LKIGKACALLVLGIVTEAAAATFPSVVNVGDASLTRVAEARYSVLWKRITDVALYVNPAQALPENGDILDPAYSKYLTIEYGMSVSAERFEKMSRELLAKNWPAQVLADNLEGIDIFCGWLQAVEKGDRYAIYWHSEKGLSLALNGEVQGSLPSKEASAIVLSLWLGRAAVSESQRDELLNSWRAGMQGIAAWR
jgi:hypothetical protein